MTTVKIALTGHRPNKLGGYDLNNPMNQAIKAYLSTIIHYALKHYDRVIGISGMALGADTLWAMALLEAKHAGAPVELHAYIPCHGYESRWPASSQAHFHALCQDADAKRYFADTYAPACLHDRNRGMVDDCDWLIAIYDGTRGGTQNAVRYAHQHLPADRLIMADPAQFK